MHTRNAVLSLPEYQKNTPFWDALTRLKHGASRVPDSIKNVYYDWCQRASKCERPMGNYPVVADRFAEAGTPASVVFAPMDAVKANIRAKHYPVLPLIEAEHLEAKSNAAFDEACLDYDPRNPASVSKLIEAAAEQVAETEAVAASALRGIRA